MPSCATHAPEHGGCRGERNLCVWARELPYVEIFSLVGRSSHGDFEGGVIGRKQCCQKSRWKFFPVAKVI